MNVYDFDETIYKKDSTRDFVFYLFKKYPICFIDLPKIGFNGLLFLFKIIDKTTFKERLYNFFRLIKDIDKELEIFVEENLHKIEPWYLNQQKEDDLVISASPYFLVKAFLDKIDVKHLIASNVDKNTGKYTGLNCYGEEKVKRYRDVYNNKEIEEFYSDSLSDTPMAKISKNAFFVIKGKITNWEL